MKRRTKLLLLGVAAASGALIALAGAVPEGFETVSNVVQSPESFEGRLITVKAIVAEGSIEPGSAGSRFAVTDTVSTLAVVFPGSLPDRFEAGRTVVVAGVLESSGGAPVLVARDIQGGCASRYEPDLG